jgi:L-fuconolactonase
MAVTWRAAHDLGLAIQIHCIPHYAVEIGELAAKFPQTPVILDHLARAGQGTPEEFDQVLKLAQMPQVYMKYSSTGVETVAKGPYPHADDAKPLVKRAYEAFGADRMVWGGLGANMTEFAREVKLFDLMFDFAPEPDRAKIRGLTAQRLFNFS